MTMYDFLTNTSFETITDKIVKATIEMTETGLSVDDPMAEIAWALAEKLDYACPADCRYSEGKHGCCLSMITGHRAICCPHYEERKENVKKAITKWLNTEMPD